jgi:SpoVK/Ycf46/Vps4 family AAA+-type ATPase
MATRGHERQQADGAIPLHTRSLPQVHTAGISDARLLPDATFAEAWSSIILPEGEKERIAQSAAAGFVLREHVAFERLPLHGIIMLVGPPGTGKTTLAHGLADRVAQMLSSLGTFAFLEINPHALASSSLGRSQQAVEQLFATTIAETAEGGPLVVLIDEVETIATDRSQLSFEANPADVHRAVDATLVGLDLVARRHRHVMFVVTSNFPQAIDNALTSRADLIVPVGLPDLAARRAILADVIHAVAEAFPGAGHLSEGDLLDRAAQESEGLDGRRLRKVIAAAAGRSPESTVDPGRLTPDDVMAAIREAVRDGGEG